MELLISLLVAAFTSVPATAGLTPSSWEEGFHFASGFGMNSPVLVRESSKSQFGLGTSLKSDFGWFFAEDYAIEAGATLVFNAIESTLVWDTLLTMGFRFRIPYVPANDRSSPYGKVFVGRGPTVVIFQDGPPPPYQESGANRLQLEGNIAGLALGVLGKTLDGQTWFAEIAISGHVFDRLDVIKNEGDSASPVILSTATIEEYTSLQTLHLSFGLIAF